MSETAESAEPLERELPLSVVLADVLNHEGEPTIPLVNPLGPGGLVLG